MRWLGVESLQINSNFESFYIRVEDESSLLFRVTLFTNNLTPYSQADTVMIALNLFKNLFVNTSYSTWNFVTPSPPWDCVLEHIAAEECVDVTGNVWEDICVIWLLGNCSMDIVTRWVLHQYTTAYTSTSLVLTSHTSTVPAAYEPVTFSSTLTTPYCRPVTAALEFMTQSLIILPRSRVSVLRSYVCRALTAALPPSCRRADDLFRPAAAVRTTVLPPRFSHATSVRHW